VDPTMQNQNPRGSASTIS